MSVTATINGKSVDIREGESILEAARRCGAEVPTLCYDSRVDPCGELPHVRRQGRRPPPPARSHPAPTPCNPT